MDPVITLEHVSKRFGDFVAVAVRAQELPRFEIRDQAPAFYKSKWFWGGVALATVAAVVINGQKRQKQEREPTTTYGYQ